MASSLQLHESFNAVYGKQRRLFDRLMRALFAVGGLLWIGWFMISTDDPLVHLQFRLHQYQLYVLLLSLWGFQSRRDTRRLSVLSQIASEQGCTVQEVPYDLVQNQASAAAFDVFDKRSVHSGWFTPVFTALFMLGGLSFIVMQIHLVLSAR